MPFLSIIVPIYKVEPYLRKCIDSILTQTFKDFELILVNDGSPDNCPNICDEYKKIDNRVKVIHKSNGGLVSARKAGLQVACGKYVGYVDSDDWIEANMYDELCKAAMYHKADIVVCDIILSYPDKKVKTKQIIKPGLYDKKGMEQFIYPFMLYAGSFYKFGLHPAVWNKIYKKEILEKNQYAVNEEIRMGEDAACTYPCILDANSLYILDNKFLYHYRQIASSMTRNYDERFIERILILYNDLKKINKEKNVFDLSNQLHYYLTYLIIGALNNEFNIKNTKNANEKRRFIKELYLNSDFNEAINKVNTKHMPPKLKTCVLLLQKKQIFVLYLFFKIRDIRKK